MDLEKDDDDDDDIFMDEEGAGLENIDDIDY
jgi:hypothetical protein